MLAIRTCFRLWGILGTEARTTAAYGEQFGVCENEESEHIAAIRLDAKEDLTRIRGYFRGLDSWWQIFENVCRFDEPAGMAGSRLGFGARSSEDRAHTTVCFVADIIATRERLTSSVRIVAC
jgi:hypothetical protein